MSILENYGPQANILSFSPRGLVSGEEYVVSLEGLKGDTSLSTTNLLSIFNSITLVADEYNEYITEESNFNPKNLGLYYLDTNGNYKEAESDTNSIDTIYYEKSITDLINFGHIKEKATTSGTANGTTTFVKNTNGLMSAGPYQAGDYYYTLALDENGRATGYVLTNEGHSYNEMVKKFGNMRLDLHSHASNNSNIDITDAKLFSYRTDDDNNIIEPGTDLTDQIVRRRWNFFSIDPNETNGNDIKKVYSKEDLKLSASILTNIESDVPAGYTSEYDLDRGKITSITGSKSNRFNLIQMLCEAFECWAKFEIEHDETGRIKYRYEEVSEDDFVEGGQYYTKNSGQSYSESDYFGDEKFTIYNGTTWPGENCYKKVYCKYVTFKEFIGDDNPVGFKYGINLQSIQRDIISDQIATKVIVQPNSNEFAPNGSCTIQQSALNPTGENALYNFQYFINHNLIDIQSLYDDLYGRHGGMGFFTKMKAWNNEIQNPIYDLATINNAINKLESNQTVYDVAIEEANKNISKLTTEINGAGGEGNSYVTDKVKQKEVYQTSLSDYTQKSINNKRLLVQYQEKATEYIERLQEISDKKNKLNQDFHRKYFRFIQEGTWTSEDYYDPELYFQAANEVLYTSSFPQISYTINVLELSQLEGFEPYKFKIADKTFIEDIEFFGYDSQGKPYQEEIVVSQLVSNLDDPSQNTITVQNYKTQFQDLFQRIAAASQSLQYAEGEYKRAAGAVNADGTINSSLMQNSLRDNELIIKNAKNQSVTWDDTGITISSFDNATSIVKLTSNGIVLTSDGGMTWTTGITGDGINASVITTGRLDTDRIRIFSDGMQTFEWNGNGLSAFCREEGTQAGYNNTDVTNGINYNKYVRFDEHGIYGYNGDANFVNGIPTLYENISEDDIPFELTWNGLALRAIDGSNYLKLSTTANSVLPIGASSNVDAIIWAGNDGGVNFAVTKDGTLYANNGHFNGDISGSTITGSAIYGGEIHIGLHDGEYYFEVTSEGKIKGLTLPQANNGTSSIVSTTNSGTKFDITSAEGDFSGTFSGKVRTNELKFYDTNVDISNMNDSNYSGYIEINGAQTSATNTALEIHSKGAGRFMADSGNLYLATGGEEVYNEVNNPQGNPKSEGWYELVNGSYELTEDITIVLNKIYYTKSLSSSAKFLMITPDGKIKTNCIFEFNDSWSQSSQSGSSTWGTNSGNTAVFG